MDRLVNVIDVESTCWEGDPPPGQSSDIVEIGVAVLDYHGLKVVERATVFVKPAHSTVSPFCTQLTTITPELVEARGVPFAEAVSTLRERFRSHERLFVSWGDYDRQMFERQCAAYDVKYPFGRRHLNAKTLYALQSGGREKGTGEALRELGIPFEGTPHRGEDDAYNIAKALAAILARGRRA